MIWLQGLLTRMRLLLPRSAESRMEEEFGLHIELEAERLIEEEGLEPAEARRRAMVGFGGMDKHREEVREGRTLGWLGGVSLDLKLAWRMLAKSPGLTVIGGLGIVVAVAVGTGFFLFIQTMMYPRINLDEGDRIVALENWSVEESNEERQSLHDFASWRENMRSVQEISAFSPRNVSLVDGDGVGMVVGARMTASGFRLARVAPHLGRYLEEADEQAGSPLVAVIGYDLWQNRFSGDPDVLGEQILLGDSVHTVVGVMPEGFSFPKSQSVWTALRADPLRHERGDGPVLFVFGRLAPGATVEGAQAELAALGARAAADFPETNEQLRPQILPYTHPIDDIQGMRLWEVAQLQFLVTLLLVAVAVNVAVLVFARTARRRGELAIRTALGASRRRIVVQLFLEGFVLTALAAIFGVALALHVMRQGMVLLDAAAPGEFGFWLDFRLRLTTVLYAVALAIIAAAIIGVIPALQSTGRQLQSDLRQLGGGTGMRLGRVWTLLIVVQVAIAVTILPMVVTELWSEFADLATKPNYPAEEILDASVAIRMEVQPGMDGEAYRRASTALFGDRLQTLVQRLEADPAVLGATYRGTLPGHVGWVLMQDEAMPSEWAGRYVIGTGVGTNYLDVLGAKMIAGRPFSTADAGSASNPVVVDHTFVEEVFGAGNAIGRRFQFVERTDDGAEPMVPGQWHEVVGVIENLGRNALAPQEVDPSLFYPLAAGELQSAVLRVHVRGGDPDDFAPALRTMVANLDPALSLEMPGQELARVLVVGGLLILLVISSVVLLSAAGIHSLMSFAVTRQQKEIGIRRALGSDPARLLRSIFARAVSQLGTGVAIGALLGGLLFFPEGISPVRFLLVVAAVAVLLLLVGSLAALGPARRGMRIQPMEALRQD